MKTKLNWRWLILTAALSNASHAATNLVTTTSDSGPGSLRQVIADVLAGTAIGPVTFDAGVTGTINLTSALPELTNDITITGPGASVMTVRRNSGGNYRIFTIVSNHTVTITGLTIANGSATNDGGGILNAGTLTVNSCVLTNNSAGAGGSIASNGGGIANDGALSVSNCTFAGNSASYSGGGIGVGPSTGFNGPLTVRDSTFAGNFAQQYGGAIDHAADPATLTNTFVNCAFSANVCGSDLITGVGGAVFHYSGALIFTNCTFTDNRALEDQGGVGGAIAQGVTGNPSVVLVKCVFTRNYAAGWGGAIEHNFGDLFVTDCLFSSNIAMNAAGAIDNNSDTPPGTLRISGCTFTGNSATNPVIGSGGAIWTFMPTTISNSTFSGNSAAHNGGAIHIAGLTTDVANVTMTLNAANTASGDGEGGAVFVDTSFFATFLIRVKDTIIANNTANGRQTADLSSDSGKIVSLGYNLIGVTNGANWTGVTGDQLGSFTAPLNPLLAPLANNGGPTPTHALLTDSPAIDAGDPSFTPPPSFDQRGPGFDRVVNGRIDIGAFEVQTAQQLVVACTLTPSLATNTVGTAHTVTATVTTNDIPAAGVTVSFSVIDGPNLGQNGSTNTDVNGQASFAYTSNGTNGTDTIQVAGVVGGVGFFTRTATKVWLAYPPGDVNGDRHVTAADSLLINQVLVHLRATNDPIFVAGFANGDVNQDAQVSSGDSLLINQQIVGLRSYIVTKIVPNVRSNNVPTPVTIFGIGFPTNTVTGVSLSAPVNLALSNVVVISREQINAIVPAGGGIGTGTVNVAATPTNGVISFGRFINQ